MVNYILSAYNSMFAMQKDKTVFLTKRNALKKFAAFAGGTAIYAQTVSADSDKKDEKSPEEERENRKAEAAFRRSVRDHHKRIISGAGNPNGEVSTQDIPGRTEVYLGQDANIDPNYGDKYESDDADSYQDAALMAEYSASSNRIEGRAYDTVGYGSFRAWSYVAHEILVKGSGSQSATITVNPYVMADMGLYGANNLGQVELIITDISDNQEWDENVVYKSGYIGEWSKSYTDSLNVTLEAGNSYSIATRLTVGTTVDGAASSAWSDFTDNNGNNHGVDVGTFDIRF